MPSRVNRLLHRESLDFLSGERNIVFVGYRGLSAEDAASVRRELIEKGVALRVMRNRIVFRALEDLGKPDVTDLFDGPTAIMDGGDDPVLVAKSAVEFAKRHEALEVKGGIIDGERCTADDVVKWSMMPSLAELLGMIAGAVAGVGGNLASAATAPGALVASQIEKIGEGQTSGETAAQAPPST